MSGAHITDLSRKSARLWLVENRDMNRVRAATLVGMITWLLGIVTILSFNRWAFEFEFAGETKTSGIFDILDILTSNIMLPLGGLAMAIFAGWMMSKSSVLDELRMAEGVIFKVWYFVVRFVTPVAVGIVFLNLIGVVTL